MAALMWSAQALLHAELQSRTVSPRAPVFPAECPRHSVSSQTLVTPHPFNAAWFILRDVAQLQEKGAASHPPHAAPQHPLSAVATASFGFEAHWFPSWKQNAPVNMQHDRHAWKHLLDWAPQEKKPRLDIAQGKAWRGAKLLTQQCTAEELHGLSGSPAPGATEVQKPEQASRVPSFGLKHWH